MTNRVRIDQSNTFWTSGARSLADSGMKLTENTSLAAKGALAHRLQRLQNPKWPPGGPKMADGVWKGVYP